MGIIKYTQVDLSKMNSGVLILTVPAVTVIEESITHGLGYIPPVEAYFKGEGSDNLIPVRYIMDLTGGPIPESTNGVVLRMSVTTEEIIFTTFEASAFEETIQVIYIYYGERATE